MRVLIAIACVVGCYDPEIDDCQFRCGQGMTCPEGATCRSGFCRTTSSNTCASDPCTNAPDPPLGCSNKFALLDPGGCGVVCTMPLRAHDEVQAACGPDWRAGILDSLTELEAVPVTNGRYWVGAERVSGSGFQWFTGAPVDPSAWDTQFPSNDNDCIYLDGGKHRLRDDRNCEESLASICTYPATN